MTMPRVLRISLGWLLACGAAQCADRQAQRTQTNRSNHRAVSARWHSDILARAIGQKLTDSLGQTIFVENKPGHGNLGATFVSKSAPMATRCSRRYRRARDQRRVCTSPIRAHHGLLSCDDGGVLAASLSCILRCRSIWRKNC